MQSFHELAMTYAADGGRAAMLPVSDLLRHKLDDHRVTSGLTPMVRRFLRLKSAVPRANIPGCPGWRDHFGTS